MKKIMITFLAFCLLVSCSDNEVEIKPNADAGADRIIPLGGVSIILDGSASTYVGATSFSWEQVSGSPVEIETPGALATSIHFPSTGWSKENRFRLTVTNEYGSSSDELEVVIDAPQVSMVKTGINSACILADGKVSCWGSGVLDAVPATVYEPDDFQVGYFHACVLQQGEVICWGANSLGQTDVPALGTVEKLWVSANVTCAQDENGRQCWGDTATLQGVDVSQMDYLAISTLNEFEAIFGFPVGQIEQSSGGWGSSGGLPANLELCQDFPDPLVESLASCQVTNNQLACDGDSLFSQFRVNLFFRRCELVNRNSIDWVTEQVSVPLQGVSKVVMGGAHACVQHGSGVSCVGDDSRDQATVPWQVVNPKDVVTGLYHSCARGDSGLSCWGDFPVLPESAVAATMFDSKAEHLCFNDIDKTVSCISSDNNFPVLPQAPFSISKLAFIHGLPEGQFRMTTRDEALFPLQFQGLGDDFTIHLRNSAPEIVTATYDSASGELRLQTHELGFGEAVVTVIAGNGEYQIKRQLRLYVPRPLYLGVEHLSVSDGFACASYDHDVICWGDTNKVVDATPYDLFHSVVGLATGTTHACAIDEAAGLLCWGDQVYADQEILDKGVAEFQGADILEFDQPLSNPYKVVIRENLSCVFDDSGLHCHNPSVPPWFQPVNQLQSVSILRNRICVIDAAGLKCWGYDGQDYTLPGLPVELDAPSLISLGMRNYCAYQQNNLQKWVCWLDSSNGVEDVPVDYLQAQQVELASHSACAIANGSLTCWGDDVETWGQPKVLSPTHLVSSERNYCAANATGVICWGHPFNSQDVPHGVAQVSNQTKFVRDGMDYNAGPESAFRLLSISSYSTQFTLQNNNPELIEVNLSDDGSFTYQPVTNAFGLGSFVISTGDGERTLDRSVTISVMPPLGSQISFLQPSRDETCAISENGISCWGSNFSNQLHNFREFSNPVHIDHQWGACVVDDNGVYCTEGTSPEVVGSITDFDSEGFISCLIDNEGLKCWNKRYPSQDVVMPTNLQQPERVFVTEDGICVMDFNGLSCVGVFSNAIPLVNSDAVIDAGYSIICAVDTSGELTCWGQDPRNNGLLSPPQMNAVTHVAIGLNHACAVNAGQLVCWGENSVGQATPPTGLDNITSLTASNNYTCAVNNFTDVICWGDTPFNHGVLDGVIWFGSHHVQEYQQLIVDQDSGPHQIDFKFGAWGDNFSTTVSVSDPSLLSAALLDGVLTVSLSPGQSGKTDVSVIYSNGTYQTEYIIAVEVLAPPALVTQLSVINNGAVASGARNSACALYDTGLQCWGGLASYQPLLANPVAVDGESGRFCAIDGQQIVCWGEATSQFSLIPAGLVNPSQISLAKGHGCVLDDNGVQCWGRNAFGQTDVPALQNPVLIEAGETFSCAYDDNGLNCWGSIPAGIPMPLSNPISLSAAATETGATNKYSYNSMCAVDDAGLSCSSNTFNLPAGPIMASRVETGVYHACAIISGQVQCWHDGSDEGVALATVPSGLDNVTALSIGRDNTCVANQAAAGPEIVCWGASIDAAPNGGVSFYHPRHAGSYLVDSYETLYTFSPILDISGGNPSYDAVSTDPSLFTVNPGFDGGYVGIIPNKNGLAGQAEVLVTVSSGSYSMTTSIMITILN